MLTSYLKNNTWMKHLHTCHLVIKTIEKSLFREEEEKKQHQSSICLCHPFKCGIDHSKHTRPKSAQHTPPLLTVSLSILKGLQIQRCTDPNFTLNIYSSDLNMYFSSWGVRMMFKNPQNKWKTDLHLSPNCGVLREVPYLEKLKNKMRRVGWERCPKAWHEPWNC